MTRLTGGPSLTGDPIKRSRLYNQIDMKDVFLSAENMNGFTIFMKYMRRQRINSISSNNSLFLTVNTELTMEQRTTMVN